MDLRQHRRLQLLVITLAALALCLITLAMGLAIYAYQKEQEKETPMHSSDRRYMGIPLPPDCGEYYNVGRPDDWARCMGVEIRRWEKGDIK